KEPISCIALTRDHRLLATGSNTGAIRVWLAATGLELREIVPAAGPANPAVGGIRGVAFTPDGKRLVSACRGRRLPPGGARKGGPPQILEQPHRPAGGPAAFGLTLMFAVAPEGDLLAAGSIGRPVRLWDTNTFKDVRRWSDAQAKGNLLAFSPSGKVLAIAER